MEMKDSDDFWDRSQRGYSFEENKPFAVGNKNLSTVLSNDVKDSRCLQRKDGLTEAMEDNEEFVTFSISPVEDENYASKLAKTFNPLTINQKQASQRKRHGPEKAVKNMILGLEYSQAEYKGKLEKIALLSEAVKSHDGNAILQVVLFLRDTLKKSIFQREIVVYPDAVNVYLTYLEEDHETDELTNMLLLTGRAEDAAILKYENAVLAQHPERKLKLIENCLGTHFQLGVTSEFLRQSVEEHKQVLEEQIKLNEYHPNEDQVLHFECLTGKKTVIDSSVLSSLIWCNLCCNTSEFQRNYASPDKFKSNYNLSKKQFTWAALRAFAVSHRWSDVDDLFISKSWRGGTKVRSCITYSRILEVLFEAPIKFLEKYVSCIENEQEKLALARKYSCHSVAIEVFKANKDRVGLLKYKASLPPHSVDFCNAADVLNNPMIRWKN